MLLLSLLQRSMRGFSKFSSIDPGLCSGEEGPLLRSSGTLLAVGGGDVAGLYVEVGLLAMEEVERSKAPILEFSGEVNESFLVLTGEEVLESDSGGGEENLRQRCGDFPSTRCSPLLFWFVAKNSSKDLGSTKEKCTNNIKVLNRFMQCKKNVRMHSVCTWS